jgi:hypothetical protein
MPCDGDLPPGAAPESVTATTSKAVDAIGVDILIMVVAIEDLPRTGRS